MTLSVLTFGIAREICGAGSVQVALDKEATVAALTDKLRSQYPELSRLTTIAIAVNTEYALPEQVLCAIDEIALIPPVSGG